MATYQFLDYPATWLTFDDSGVLYEVRYDSPFRFLVSFHRLGGGTWGPFDYPAGQQTIPINKNLNKRFADVQSISVVNLTHNIHHRNDAVVI